MVTSKTRRLRVNLIQSDKDVVSALEKITNYNPNAPELALLKLQEAHKAMIDAQAACVQTEAAFKAAYDNAALKEIQFHNLVLRVKKNILAQFGEDSNEAQAIGLKKKSDYRAPKRIKEAA
ncbi:hypothetical protein HUU42_02925 [bacterium]|nr:hypothetical protein [bacterium]